jgi:uncharacterized membrane protein
MLAPMTVRYDGPLSTIGRASYFFFGQICHQVDSRSFHVDGNPLGVCIRCTGIYFGFLLGTFLFFVFGKDSSRHTIRLLLIVALIPILLDTVSGALGVYAITEASRFLTGAWFGIVVPWCLTPLFVEAASTRRSSREHPLQQFYGETSV